MLFSMFSPLKKIDKELLLEIAETIELLIKIKTPQALDLAEQLGDNYIQLETKIKTFEYRN